MKSKSEKGASKKASQYLLVFSTTDTVRKLRTMRLWLACQIIFLAKANSIVDCSRLINLSHTFSCLFFSQTMIEVVLNDRLGKKVRVKCNEDDTIGDLKKLGS